MKILVIDDTNKHLDAARQTLAEHELTTCSSFDDAISLIVNEKWDAVLTDFIMPIKGNDEAVGWLIAIKATGAKVGLVGVVTDMFHHKFPASLIYDHINRKVFSIEKTKVIFSADPPMIGIVGTEQKCKCDESAEAYCPECGGSGIFFREMGKNWGIVLNQLTKA